MKQYVYIILSAFALSLAGCENLLEPEIVIGNTAEQVLVSYDNTEKTVVGVYTYLPDGFSYVDGTLLAGASDEAEHTLETNAVQKFNNASWNAVDNPDNAWSRNFQGIYNANLTLQNIDSVKMDYLKLDSSSVSQQQYQINLANMERWKYELRVLRAFFYFELVKRYGGVPIVTDPLQLTDDFTKYKRNTLTECFNFIVAECDTAANHLPLPSEMADENLGRVSKGAALALKSRALLYAASDLYNDPSWAGGYAHPELISMTDNKTREQRWQEAAIAAKDVMDLEAYSLVMGALGNSYRDVFSTYNNSELILTRRYGSSNSFESANYPIGYNGGNSGITPLGNLVDAYEMTNGSDFDWSVDSLAKNPYENRDPRLKATILTNNEPFDGGTADPNRRVEIWAGGRDGQGVPRATRTGYYIRKWIDPGLDLLQGRSSVHNWCLIRYAEIYLNYAEAVTHGYGYNGRVPGGQTPAQVINMYIRRRVGLGVVNARSVEQMMEIYKHERQIELAFEDHRLWDVRRWMDAPEVLGAPARGVNITKNDDGTFTYEPFVLEERVWEDKMYFYPIPQKELSIANWPQNPMW